MPFFLILFFFRMLDLTHLIKHSDRILSVVNVYEYFYYTIYLGRHYKKKEDIVIKPNIHTFIALLRI